MAKSNAFYNTMNPNQMVGHHIDNRLSNADPQATWQQNDWMQNPTRVLSQPGPFDVSDPVDGFRRGTNLPPYFVTRRGYEGIPVQASPVDYPVQGYLYGQTFIPVQEQVEEPIEWIYGAPRYDVSYYDEVMSHENGTYVETKAHYYPVDPQGQPLSFGRVNAVKAKKMPAPMTTIQPTNTIDYRGVGPQGYQRSAETIQDEICRYITEHPGIDASDTEVKVTNDGVVELKGSVDSRHTKRLVENCCDRVRGVQDVRNNLKIDPNFWRDAVSTSKKKS